MNTANVSMEDVVPPPLTEDETRIHAQAMQRVDVFLQQWTKITDHRQFCTESANQHESHRVGSNPASVTLDELRVVLEPQNDAVTAELCAKVFPLTFLISACLLGRPVVYHGEQPKRRTMYNRRPRTFEALVLAHKLLKLDDDKDCTEGRVHIVPLFQFQPLCPEVDLMKMSTPRPPLRQTLGAAGEKPTLSYDAANGDLVDLRPLLEHATMDFFNEESLKPKQLAFDGFIARGRSPTCGLGDSRIQLPLTRRDSLPQSSEEPRRPFLPGQDGAFTALLKARSVGSDGIPNFTMANYDSLATVPMVRSFFDRTIVLKLLRKR